MTPNPDPDRRALEALTAALDADLTGELAPELEAALARHRAEQGARAGRPVALSRRWPA